VDKTTPNLEPNSVGPWLHDLFSRPKQQRVEATWSIEEKRGETGTEMSFERGTKGHKMAPAAFHVGGRRSASRWTAEARDTEPSVQVSWEEDSPMQTESVHQAIAGLRLGASCRSASPRCAVPTALVTPRTKSRQATELASAGRARLDGTLARPLHPRP
jgi:hypothetical protein